MSKSEALTVVYGVTMYGAAFAFFSGAMFAAGNILTIFANLMRMIVYLIFDAL